MLAFLGLLRWGGAIHACDLVWVGFSVLGWVVWLCCFWWFGWLLGLLYFAACWFWFRCFSGCAGFGGLVCGVGIAFPRVGFVVYVV